MQETEGVRRDEGEDLARRETGFVSAGWRGYRYMGVSRSPIPSDWHRARPTAMHGMRRIWEWDLYRSPAPSPTSRLLSLAETRSRETMLVSSAGEWLLQER